MGNFYELFEGWHCLANFDFANFGFANFDLVSFDQMNSDRGYYDYTYFDLLYTDFQCWCVLIFSEVSSVAAIFKINLSVAVRRTVAICFSKFDIFVAVRRKYIK